MAETADEFLAHFGVKGKSVALGLIGGPISLVVVSEISARKNAKA